MSNEDKRRRRDGSTAQLSVAELLARREAETQPIPIYRDDEEDTIRFQAVTPPAATAPAALSTVRIDRQSLSGRELHVAELLRREGRPADDERGGMKISKLVAIASGGVVLCGTVAFGASQWLSSPDERPLADVRFDNRPAARNSSNTGGIGALALPGQQANPSTQGSTTTPQTETETQAPQTQDQRTAATQQAPATQNPATTDTTTSTTETTTQQPTPDKGEPTANPTTTTSPSSSSSQPTSSTSTPPASSNSSTTPSSSTPSSSQAPSTGVSLGVGLGGFDFFAEL